MTIHSAASLEHLVQRYLYQHGVLQREEEEAVLRELLPILWARVYPSVVKVHKDLAEDACWEAVEDVLVERRFRWEGEGQFVALIRKAALNKGFSARRLKDNNCGNIEDYVDKISVISFIETLDIVTLNRDNLLRCVEMIAAVSEREKPGSALSQTAGCILLLIKKKLDEANPAGPQFTNDTLQTQRVGDLLRVCDLDTFEIHHIEVTAFVQEQLGLSRGNLDKRMERFRAASLRDES